MQKIFSLILTLLSVWLPMATGALMLAGAIWLRNVHLAITGIIFIAVASLFALLTKYSARDAASRQTQNDASPPPT